MLCDDEMYYMYFDRRIGLYAMYFDRRIGLYAMYFDRRIGLYAMCRYENRNVCYVSIGEQECMLCVDRRIGLCYVPIGE